MGFRLVSKSVTLNDHERRDGRVVCVISPNRLLGPITYKMLSCRRDHAAGCAIVFTALHEMQTRSSDENSVCPSVRLSVRHTRDP